MILKVSSNQNDSMILFYKHKHRAEIQALGETRPDRQRANEGTRASCHPPSRGNLPPARPGLGDGLPQHPASTRDTGRAPWGPRSHRLPCSHHPGYPGRPRSSCPFLLGHPGAVQALARLRCLVLHLPHFPGFIPTLPSGVREPWSHPKETLPQLQLVERFFPSPLLISLIYSGGPASVNMNCKPFL